MTISSETIALLKEILTHPTVNMPDFDDTTGTERPAVATVREIEIVANQNSGFDLLCTGATYIVAIDSSYTIEHLVLDVHRPNYAFETESPQEQPPYSSCLSIKNPELTYVVFKLKNDNLQFNRSGHPFSIGLSGVNEGYYRQARRVDNQGSVVPNTKTIFGSKVAFFAADGRRISTTTGEREFIHPFNIHLEWVTQGADEFGNAMPSFIPIIIDPDVRYPGGTGP